MNLKLNILQNSLFILNFIKLSKRNDISLIMNLLTLLRKFIFLSLSKWNSYYKE